MFKTILLLKTYFFLILPFQIADFNIFETSKHHSHTGCHSTSNATEMSSHTCQLHKGNTTLAFGADLAKHLKDNSSYFEQNTLKTVVLDAGHGGKDYGTYGKSYKEKNLTLSMTKLLGQYIQNAYPDVQVIYTRTTDVFVPLEKRAKLANENEADLFISLHCNALSKNKKIRGTETYVMGLTKADENLEVVKRENEAILLEENYKQTYSKYDPESPEGHILLSMYQNAYLEQSINFASKVEDQFQYVEKRKSRGVKQAGFVVLRATTMPSVLVETGYLTNSQDAAYLKSYKGQTQVAKSVFEAFKAYKLELDGTLPLHKPQPQVKPKPISQATPPPAIKTVDKAALANHYEFKIQLAASDKTINTQLGIWKKVGLIEIEQYGSSFKYMTSGYKDYQKTIKKQNAVRALGFKGAFVVAYKNGQRINLKTALEEIGQ